jgi:DNA-binding MarR family transcriptional regulator
VLLIDQLEKGGLVRRTPVERDRRRVLVERHVQAVHLRAEDT